jgi:hypothetical protein
LIIFSDDLLAKISSLLCSTFCWWDLYFAYFDQKQTLIYSETHVKLVGLTVLFLPFHLYISFCFYTYVSFIYCSFFLQLYITPFCNYMPLCLGIHEYYSHYSISLSDRLHKTFLPLQALGKKMFWIPAVHISGFLIKRRGTDILPSHTE